jgi:14-3-3 protein epsilon
LPTVSGRWRAKAHSIHVLRGLHNQRRSRGRAAHCQKLDEHITSELSEFLEFYNRFVTTLDQSLISAAKDDTSAMIFWLKMKADFLRFQTEFLTDPARTHTAGQAVQCYEETLSTARVEFSAPNSLWFAVAFNYSVFLFETQRQSKQAISVARTVLEDSAGLTNSGNETEFKEATRLQEFIRQNLAGWTHDEAA